MSSGHLKEALASEGARFEALRDYGLLSSGSEHAFDRITQLVSDVFAVPQACLSLIDDHFQWFQTSENTDRQVVPREESFCHHIVTHDAPLIVPDAARDPRFAHYPYVVGAPHIRFYAGVPLRAEAGFVLGALCIISHEPRPPLTADEIQRLEDFAEIIMAEVNLRYAIRERDDARIFLESAVNFSEMVVWQYDPVRDSLTLNGAVEALWGAETPDDIRMSEDAMGRIHPEDRDAVRDALVQATMNKAPFHQEFRVVHPGDEVRWISARADWAMRDKSWVLTGINADLTEQKNRQNHANVLMRELHHRMRNLFATVGAIISLTRQSAENIDDYIERITYRLDALNRAQNVLLSANFMTGSMHALMREVEAGFPRIRWSGTDLLLPENALVAMALLLNELATNAVKHGALMSDAGDVEVHWWHETSVEGDRRFHMRWCESGAVHGIGPPERTRFGTLLMDRSVQNNLGGHIERRWEADGLVCDIILPARWREN